MTSITQQGNQWHIFGDVLMQNANAILAQSEILSMGDKVEVDFSGTTNIDTSALSLIMEWQRRAMASKCKVSFANIPPNLKSLAELYGVTAFIPLAKT